MEKQQVGPKDFETEVARLQREGKMPPLEDILAAVAGVREKYAPAIIAARKGDTQ